MISPAAVLGGVSDVLNIGTQVSNLVGRRIQHQREDTAVQRRVKDLESAGLNKVLAAGSAAQSSPIMVGGSKVGGMADAALKEVSEKLQEGQSDLVKQNLTNAKDLEIIRGPQVYDSRVKFSAMHNIMSGSEGGVYSKMVRKNIVDQRVNESEVYDKARSMNVPVEFLLSGPGQQIMMNQYIESLSKQEKFHFLKNMALLGIAGSAGGAVKKMVPGVSIGK